jgi:hypothetical protein
MARKPLDTSSITATRLGLPADIIGKTVFIYGRALTVDGFHTNRPKYPISVTGPNGGKYKVTVDQVLTALGTATATPTPTVPTGMRASHAVFSGWRPGMRCKFTTKDGDVIVGTVKRVNQRSVSVTPDVNPERYWRVSPGLLKAA